MKLLRSVLVAIRPALQPLMTALDQWMLKTSIVGFIGNITVCDIGAKKGIRSPFLSLTQEALELVRKVDARRYRRIVCNSGSL